MGLSSIKGNGGYIGVDKRGEVSSSGSTGNISVRKHYLERRRGNLTPEPPTTDVLFQDNFSSGDLSKWSVYNGSQNSQWVVGDSTSCLNENGDSQTIPSGSTFAAYLSDDNGVTNTYEDNTNAHMVFGFTIPDDVTITTLTLEFDWMCSGERGGGVDSYDYGYLNYINPSTFTPSGGGGYATSSGTGREKIIGTNTSPNTDNGKFSGEESGSRNNDAKDGWVYENITLDSNEITTGVWCDNGCDRGIMFSWRSDGSVLNQPGWTVANVKLTYNV